MPRLSKIGAAALAAFGWTSGSTVSASYLVVAGGGGAGCHGGGGAGGFLTGTTSLIPTQSYTVLVGAGGAGIASGASGGSNGSNGANSQFGTLTASVGGGAGGGYVANNAGSTGGSGGGGGYSDPIGSALGGAGTSGQGNAGGSGFIGGAGGGGANAVGSNGGGSGSAGVGGAGGNGTASSISGSSVTYAGGGGGGNGDARTGGSGGAGGSGGGGAGSTGTLTTGAAGTANLGGGGGGGGSGSGTNYGGGGQGGSGVVIISYVGAQQFGGGVVTSVGGNTIHTFNTSGTLSPLSSLTASYLIVAGGGGGGTSEGGGGGAGGMQTGSSLTIDKNSIYAVTVGAGGAGAANGTNSSFSLVSTASVGGGGGGTSGNGSNGGSGGGGGANGSGTTSGGTATSGQGNAGGTGAGVSSNRGAGGGGGAGAVGGNGTGSSGGIGGAGGNGLASSITGSSVTYAGGGGGNSQLAAGSYTASGGTGGGGTGGNTNALIEATNGTTNLGGGGGGGSYNGYGGLGGSGVVIISYPGSTQQMAGGTVTVAGGNVIHTFTSSGYLTPIVLVANSLRFRSSASAYLNRTPATASNRKTWTWSGWVKRGTLGVSQYFFSGGTGGGDTTQTGINFLADDRLNWLGGSGTQYRTTTQVFRDPSAWYHIVLAFDTTLATANDRIKIYVNGTQITAFDNLTNPTQNLDYGVNQAEAHNIGRWTGASGYFDGYMAEINFIDGQALTPFSFGTTSDLGVWQPIRYGGSYGTNGFYLKFTDTTSTTTLSYDYSPNGNNWTPNNISLTAGSTYDSMTDVPTLTSATTANYAVLNPLEKGANVTISDGNLKYSSNSASGVNGYISMYITTGMKSYFEFTCGSAATYRNVAIGGMVYAGDTGLISGGTGGTGTFATWTTGDVVRFACDYNAGTIACYKNATLQTTVTGVTNTSPWVIIPAQSTGLGEFTANFGQQPFSYTPPSGFVALNTFNLPTPTIGATASTTANEYFDATLYTGNSTTNNIVNAGGMQPDLVWIKSRSNAQNNNLFDSIRGAGYVLFSNATNAETNNTANFTSFNSNGFSLASNGGDTNLSGYTYVGWQWRASNTTPVSNTAGSITSTVSANTTAGFSIVTWTGNGTSGATVGHGLGVTPSMVILKSRSSATNWQVKHSSLNANQNLTLNTTDAVDTAPGSGYVSAISSSTLTLLNGGSSIGNVNGSGDTYVSYCFAPIAGYSAFGSYTSNNSTDGPFIYTGFRPRYVLIKAYSNAGESWNIFDSARGSYNVNTAVLFADSSSAEATNSSIDFLSNGFKLRSATGGVNYSSYSYIYMAFAENPFKYANAR